MTRAALLVAWVRALQLGAASAPEVLSALRGHDESIEFRSDEGKMISGGELLAAWTAEGWGVPRLVLPVPGDPRGLVGPHPATTAAFVAGEAVVTNRMVLVPSVEAFGNDIEGYTTITTWQLFAVSEGPRYLPGSGVSEADRELRATMLTTVEVLASLNQSRWSPDLAEAVADIRTLRRDGEPFASSLPPVYTPAARELVARARVIHRIVELAAEDDSAVLTSLESAQRRGALADLAGAVRAALLAGINEGEDVADHAGEPARRTNPASAPQ